MIVPIQVHGWGLAFLSLLATLSLNLKYNFVVYYNMSQLTRGFGNGGPWYAFGSILMFVPPIIKCAYYMVDVAVVLTTFGKDSL